MTSTKISKAAAHGAQDARTFFSEHPLEARDASEFASDQLGADEALINAIGVQETAELFGLARGGTARFSRACDDYNRAFDSELAKLRG